MTFYERDRGGRGNSLELPAESTRELTNGVLRGEPVSRTATVVDGDTLVVRHDLLSFPGIQVGGWPAEVIYVGRKANDARLWIKSEGKGPDQRIIWKPQPGIRG